MKQKEFTDLKKESVEKLLKIVAEKKKALLSKKMEILSSKEKNVKAAWSISKDIAKLFTIIREKSIIEGSKTEVRS